MYHIKWHPSNPRSILVSTRAIGFIVSLSRSVFLDCLLSSIVSVHGWTTPSLLTIFDIKIFGFPLCYLLLFYALLSVALCILTSLSTLVSNLLQLPFQAWTTIYMATTMLRGGTQAHRVLTVGGGRFLAECLCAFFVKEKLSCLCLWQESLVQIGLNSLAQMMGCFMISQRGRSHFRHFLLAAFCQATGQEEEQHGSDANGSYLENLRFGSHGAAERCSCGCHK